MSPLDALLHKFVEVPSGLGNARDRGAEPLDPATTPEESALGDRLHGEVVQRVLEPGLLEALTAYRVAASDAEARGDEEGSREAASALLREIGRARETGSGFGFDHDGSTSRQFRTDRDETSSKYDEGVADDIKGWSPLLVVCTACVCVVLAGLVVVAVVQVQATATVRHHTVQPEKNARRRRKGGDKVSKPVGPLGAGFRHSRGDPEDYREPRESTLGGLRRRKPGSGIARDQAVWPASTGGRFQPTREAPNSSGTRQVKHHASRGTAHENRGAQKSESTLLDVTSSSSEFSGEERSRVGGVSATQHSHWETRPGEESGALPVTRRVPHTSPAVAEKQQAYEDECRRLFSRLGELAPAERSVPCLEKTEESSKEFLSDEADVQEADEIVTALRQMFDSIEKDFQGNRPAYVTCMIRCCNSLLHLDGLMVLSRCTKKQRLQDKAQKIIETVVPCIWSS
ncbi:transmembrane protein [Cystoisospora suis]|uniref:Transmembrane protein n=1 Tax=Cystoisospora suis TaxID=483139 RepID=A0A2C6JEX4_9APIC|nr:transmembrane protein [Cystoisospora suis]